ncbi:MAG: hypothetical protein WDO13_16375 [Verrucomicrobiota bacterium]
MDHEKITLRGAGYDPQKAVWKPVAAGFPVADGTIFFVKMGGAVYAVKLVHQTAEPERAEYAWLAVGGTAPVVTGVAQTLPGGIALPGHMVGWSGKGNGAGYVYLDDGFIWNQPPRYTIGVPFQSATSSSFRTAVPAGTHFESLPWNIPAADDDAVVPAP